MLLWGWAGAFGAKWRLTHDSLQVLSNWASSSAKLNTFHPWFKSQCQVAGFVDKHTPEQDLASQGCSAQGCGWSVPFTLEHPLLFLSRRTRSLSRCLSLAQLTSPPREGPALQPGPAGGRGTRAECVTRPPGGPASPLPRVRPDSEWE